jgi:hypothetical protein
VIQFSTKPLAGADGLLIVARGRFEAGGWTLKVEKLGGEKGTVGEIVEKSCTVGVTKLRDFTTYSAV